MIAWDKSVSIQKKCYFSPNIRKAETIVQKHSWQNNIQRSKFFSSFALSHVAIYLSFKASIKYMEEADDSGFKRTCVCVYVCKKGKSCLIAKFTEK